MIVTLIRIGGRPRDPNALHVRKVSCFRSRSSPRRFEIPLAGHPEQIHSPPLDVIEIAKAALDPRHDAAQGELAGAERLGTNVLAIHHEQIEREKKAHSRRNRRSLKLLMPSGFRQQISPSRMAECARTEWATSSANCGQDLKVWPLREMRVQWWPFTCARARNPSILGPRRRSSQRGRRARGGGGAASGLRGAWPGIDPTWHQQHPTGGSPSAAIGGTMQLHLRRPIRHRQLAPFGDLRQCLVDPGPLFWARGGPYRGESIERR